MISVSMMKINFKAQKKLRESTELHIISFTAKRAYSNYKAYAKTCPVTLRP
jgi:hypothetical protein